MGKRGKKTKTAKTIKIVKPSSVRTKKSVIQKCPKKEEDFSPRSMRNKKVIKYVDDDEEFRPRSVCVSPKKIKDFINETSQIKNRTQSKKINNNLIKKNNKNNKGKINKKNNKGKKKNNRNNKKQKKEENEEIVFEEIDIIESDDSKKNKKDNNDLFNKEMIKDLKPFMSQTINDSIKILNEEQKKFFEDIKNEQQLFFVKINESILNLLSLNSNNCNSVNNEIKKEKIVNSQNLSV